MFRVFENSAISFELPYCPRSMITNLYFESQTASDTLKRSTLQL